MWKDLDFLFFVVVLKVRFFFFNNLNNLIFQFKYLDKLNFKGWTGRLCDEDIDECITSPCKNGGLCINIPASYTCACLFGKLQLFINYYYLNY